MILLRTLHLGIQTIEGIRRTIYEQLDGTVILADECMCGLDPFTCPIDKHALEARQKELKSL